MRGGGRRNNDPDREHARIVELLAQIGINPNAAIRDIGDSSQIVFFQECGGFPLRALQGMEEMKKAYEEHRKSGKQPLHIVRDEIAERFPDLEPPNPNDIERARMMKAVGMALGFIIKHDFFDSATQKMVQKYAFPREDPILDETLYAPLSESEEGIVVRLAYNLNLLKEVEGVIEQKMKVADEGGKQVYRQSLMDYLQRLKERLRPKAEERGIAVEDLPEYQREADLVRQFIRQWLM